MGTLMGLKGKEQLSAAQELCKVKVLLQELQQANEQLEQEKAQRNALEQQQLQYLDALVAERTQELHSENLNLRMQMAERLKAEQQLYFEAHHDALTKLANRAMFSDRLIYAIRHLKR